MYEGRIQVLDVVDFAANLPRGGAVAEWLGGWGAITGEEEALRRVEYVLVATNAKRRPKPPKPPVSIREKEIADRANAKQRAAKAEALRSMSKLFQ